MKVIDKVVTIQDVGKVRDKLIKLLEKEKGHNFTDQELKYNTPEEIQDNCIDWVIEEIQEAFDFDGDDEKEGQQ